jgi:acetyltransferase-like isoleucine patch superfamily enzyme
MLRSEAEEARSLDEFLNKVKRADGPFYRQVKKLVRKITSPKVNRLPGFLRPMFRFLYEMHFGAIMIWHTFWNIIYFYPLFQARCASIGRNVSIDRMPFVIGPVQIHIGDDVWLGGNIQISSGRILKAPQLIIHDHAQINWSASIVVNREVVIEEYVRISWNCTITDSDGHPRQADLRAQNEPVNLRDIRPVRICKYAWIGNGSYILKGVTIGEGAVIGANSVVISDVPPYSLALGNPAEVVIRNYGRPAKTNPAEGEYPLTDTRP